MWLPRLQGKNLKLKNYRTRSKDQSKKCVNYPSVNMEFKAIVEELIPIKMRSTLIDCQNGLRYYIRLHQVSRLIFDQLTHDTAIMRLETISLHFRREEFSFSVSILSDLSSLIKSVLLQCNTGRYLFRFSVVWRRPCISTASWCSQFNCKIFLCIHFKRSWDLLNRRTCFRGVNFRPNLALVAQVGEGN